jgi:hypothetical protein
MDDHLVPHLVQVIGNFCRQANGERVDHKITGEWIENVQRRPRLARRHVKRQQTWQGSHQRERVFVLEEAVGRGRIAYGGPGAPGRGAGEQRLDPGAVILRRERGRGISRCAAGIEAANEPVGSLFGIGWRTARGLHRLKPLQDLIQACQAIADQLRGNREIARPCLSQDVFRRMDRSAHRREFDNAGSSLQGMKGAKGAIERAVVVRRLLEGQQILRCLLDEFARLDQELFQELVHRGSPQNIAA